MIQSTHHTDDAICPLCEAKLLTAHKLLGTFFRAAKVRWPDIHVAWAFRSSEEQQEVYNKGKSNAMPGESLHNAIDSKKKPCSRAVDIFVIDADGIARWPEGRFAQMHAWKDTEFKHVMRLGVIQWKSRITGKMVLDLPHFELNKDMVQP